MRTEPLGRVFDLAARPTRIFEMVAVALLFHGVAAADTATFSQDLYNYARAVRMAVNERLATEYEVDIVPPPPPPPEPPPEEKKPDEPPPPEPDKTPPPVAKTETKEVPAPPQAQAGAVLTKAPNPDEPVDLTNSMVSGNGTTFAGGVTSAQGHGGPTYNTHAQVNGTTGSTGTAAVPAVDRSKPLKRTDDTDCRNFPPEADRDSQQVRVRVTVGPDGKLTGMQVVKDPGEGFGREARVCVAKFRFEPALDRNGQPMASTQDFNISFER